ncbi:MAG: alpha/beta fold hydrolase [Actinomycetota bacterium]
MELRTAEIHGKTMGYRMTGEGPAIVLIHGMAGSSETWTPLLEKLGGSATVIAPDMPGHGASAKPRGDYSLGSLASGIRDLLIVLGIDRATIVGHSLGGGVAMQFAYQFPERCERLVLVSSGGLGREVSALLRTLSAPGAEYVLALGCSQRVRKAGIAVGGWLSKVGIRPTPALGEVWRSYSSLSDPETRTAFLHTLRSVIDVGGQRVSALDRLYLAAEVPTLIVWGDRDPFIPVAHGRDAKEAMPGSRLEIFEGSGHFPHRDSPDRFAGLLTEFIAGTEPASISVEGIRERLRGTGIAL